ncbi:hypothetical protein A6A03_09700 [Chloroflexus islandicus]|uniref:HTH OST-type domain-containing protein n=1 Tax=Chloroflexus islandicus TaxID=1707952 RepID=A0A178MG94_9CHLR|nr:NYN domain-containing protein [Chloroflexus islandicus]OAN47710.1 hypothetical protein A6A03_09700 [Chloroflexus islandicus]
MPPSPSNLSLKLINDAFHQLTRTNHQLTPTTNSITTPATLIVPERRVALLIDGENCPATYAEQVMRHLAHEPGPIVVRRVYANWSLPNNHSWIEPVARYDLRPIHQGRVATNKNAIDILLTVEAMELLYQERITCFYLAASDSDYTPLINRLRAAGAEVIVIGNGHTSDALKEACTRFIPLSKPEPAKSDENASMAEVTPPQPAPTSPHAMAAPPSLAATQPSASPLAGQSASSTATTDSTAATIRPLYEAAFLMVQAICQAPKRDHEGWVGIGVLGQQLRRLDRTFTANQFGYSKLSQLIAACVAEYPHSFELRESNPYPLDVRHKVRAAILG